MKHHIGRFFLLAIFIMAGTLSKAQNVDSLLQILHDSFPEEKVHVHFDKSYYNPGETIWFKAYIFSGIEPSIISKSFYAELIDESGNIISRHSAPIIESGSAGSFLVSDKYNRDVLYFRAYTTNMMSGDTAFLYFKQLRIITPVKTNIPKAPALKAFIRFLPEGGDWVAGLAGVIAFKAIDQAGLPVKASGVLRNKEGKKVGEFATTYDGMGTILMTPQKGELYTALWKDPAGNEYITPLPPVKDEGLILQVAATPTGKGFVVTRSENAPPEQRLVRIVATMNQRMLYSAKANLSDATSKSGVLPTKDLPSGILQITVFDNNFKPLAERVVFVNNREYEFDGDVYLGVKNTEKRGLNKGEVIISDTMLSNLSLSITDADLNSATRYEDNIVSRMLLTGELRGKIANPYYYFFSTDDSASINLNLVMLTHGWRRYDWTNIIAGKFPPTQKPESNFLSIKGQLVGMDYGKLKPGTSLTGILQAKDSSKVFISLPIDRKGQMIQDGMIFYDYAKLYFQFSDTKRRVDKSSVNLDNGLYKGYAATRIEPEDKLRIVGPDSVVWAKNVRQNSEETKMAALRMKKAQMLQEVIVKGKTKTEQEKLDDKYASGLFSGGDARVFDVANDPFGASSFSVFQYLQGKVAGLQISMAGGNPTMSWRGGTPVLYLNEMQSDASLVSGINMNEVAYIKVFRPGASGGFSTQGGGAIAIYTKKGGDVNTNDPDARGLEFIQLPGYTDVKEFMSPDYATASSLHDVTDLRSTLYWNPYIFLDKKTRRFRFQFYNTDVTKRFRIVLEGINEEGKVIHVEKFVEQ